MKKSKQKTAQTTADLDLCKHCKAPLTKHDLKRMGKKYLTEKAGIWGGVERPYIQVVKINCSNIGCHKKYSVRLKGSDWLYK